MQDIINWYWSYGINRGNDINDPDRKLRKISLGGWLDPIVQIVDRNNAIKNNINQKACLALWGPSQTGKSTMMSRYVDGLEVDGSESALTWADDKKTRFSPSQDGVNQIPDDTLIFNPFNHQSDASGVATRYTLKSVEDTTVNVNYPIQLKFTTRSQIIQSLSLGYLSQCEKSDEESMFTQESFLEELSNDKSDEEYTPDPEAYSLVKDIANVIEDMRGNPRFSNLFKRNEWKNKIRRVLVSSHKLLSSKKATEEFLARIFWDSNARLTKFYNQIDNLFGLLQNEWKGCSILATMEVGALILDIDSYKSYVEPRGNQEQKVKDQVSKIGYEHVDNQILISVCDSQSYISGDNFGCFQALCAELIVPLKKENLNSITKEEFVKFAEKCDILDFPGVSNINRGNNVNQESAALVDLHTAPESELFTKVFKQGKTQCIIYNYVKKYGIDAFAVLVRTDRYPSQSTLLNSGICEWISSYDSNWKPGLPTEMPVFINMTFFSSLINNVSMNGVGAGLNPYVERIQGELTFAHKSSAKFFATTYHQFHDGMIGCLSNKDDVVTAILNDNHFVNQTGLTKENIEAVYNIDGGLDYMLSKINSTINTYNRKSRCENILSKDKQEILRLIASQLPSSEELNTESRRIKIIELRNKLDRIIDVFCEDFDSDGFIDLSCEIKKIFAVSADIFDPMLLNTTGMTKKDIVTYVKDQISKWFNYKISNLEEGKYISIEDQKELLIALRDSFNKGSIVDALSKKFSQIRDMSVSKAARFPIALMFENILRTGCVEQKSDTIVGERNSSVLDSFINAEICETYSSINSPYYYSIVRSFLERLDQLSENTSCSERPPQCGDNELKQIYDKIMSNM